MRADGAFKTALRAGVKFAFGTDSGVSPHGHNAEEFALLVGHGMTPQQALKTIPTAADLLGLGASVGTLLPSRRRISAPRRVIDVMMWLASEM